MIRSARQAAGITQLELAGRAGTAQPAIAAYESGGRTPSIATLERLLGACEHDVEVLAWPRVRRGAASLAELGQTIGEDLAGITSVMRCGCCSGSPTTSGDLSPRQDRSAGR